MSITLVTSDQLQNIGVYEHYTGEYTLIGTVRCYKTAVFIAESLGCSVYVEKRINLRRWPKTLPIPEDDFEFSQYTTEERTVQFKTVTKAGTILEGGMNNKIMLWDMMRLEDDTVLYGITGKRDIPPDNKELVWVSKSMLNDTKRLYLMLGEIVH